MPPSPGLQVRDERQGAVLRLTLDRPAVHNALDGDLVASLRAAFGQIATDHQVRVVVLDGNGPSFCAGADIAEMRRSLELDEAANRGNALDLADLFRDMDACPVPVVALVHGVVLGGGVGLVATCDHVIAISGTRFGLTETRLGILPAVIAPYVVGRIGAGASRSLVLTGRRFDTTEAQRLGLVHVLVEDARALAESGRAAVDDVLAGGPTAIRIAKRLLREVGSLDADSARQVTADLIAHQRVSEEGQEGLRAFLEKRRPSWPTD